MLGLTRHTDVTAASIELLTGAGAALLLRCGVNMDVVWTVLQILSQHSKARAVVLSSPEHASLGPVGPENVLLEDGQGERVLDTLHDHLSVLTSQSGPLYPVTMGRRRGKGTCQHKLSSIGSALIPFIKKQNLQ